ncbi:hypothetical protein DB88DRAFT_511496 [Papiliotrema laurentii]|uniref:Zn(2)-C6 fungal-type domain-containing protein n=1 Tax=Papiliotrema laurentii TaxID=5418 RepID=A0AAD9CYR0_PAPLA|nr:hypothetical protein DB88DRAFT_511496 [Papiliotrema laurentii]
MTRSPSRHLPPTLSTLMDPTPSDGLSETTRDGSESLRGSSSTPRRRGAEHGPKNLQACDRCRAKKVKCLPEDSSRHQCKACHRVNLGCTFDMPLTASRTKRVRKGLAGPAFRMLDVGQARENGEGASGLGLLADHAVLDGSGRETGFTGLRRPRTSTMRQGATSLNYILHSAPSLPLYLAKEYGATHGISLHRRTNGPGAGFISIERDKADDEEASRSTFLHMIRSSAWALTVQKLVEAYFVETAPLLPIVDGRHDFDGEDNLGLLEHAMALVASTGKDCPKDVFDALRWTVNTEVERQDVLFDVSRYNIQVLLVLCLSDDIGPPDSIAATQSIRRGRLSRAVQMMRDLEVDRSDEPSDRQLWACAAILDVWCAAKDGAIPLIPQHAVSSLSPLDVAGDLQHTLAVSICLSAILHHVYGSRGLAEVDLTVLVNVRDELRTSRNRLPEHLRLTSLSSSTRCGLLHLLHTTALFLLYRPFMRWSFSVDPQYTLDLDLRVWEDIHGASSAGLEWLTNHPDPSRLLGWGTYTAGIAAFVQYHHWARRREASGVIMLEKVVGCAGRWVEGDKLAVSKEELGILRFLHGATERLVAIPPAELGGFERGLDPTPGSRNSRLSA